MHRYKNKHIYTYVGDILVSVNPFQKLDIYNDEVCTQINDKILDSLILDTHVFFQYCGQLLKNNYVT